MMKKKNYLSIFTFSLIVLLLCSGIATYADQGINESLEKIDKHIKDNFDELQIPGMSVIIVNGKDTYIKNYGYANRKDKEVVTPNTKYEIASCSKSFTGLAVVKLVDEGLVNLDDPVSKYLPWFYLKYNGEKIEVTVEEVMHHISGIPRTTISKIPVSSEDDAIEKTVMTLVGMEIPRLPGEEFEYATINYDILGAIIEKVAGTSYEEYMENNIFKPLGLNNTLVGKNPKIEKMAQGYKLGFLGAREYDAPEYRGNNPAGYIITDSIDMARWLQIQMGIINTDLDSLIEKTHTFKGLELKGEEDSLAYTMGWFVNETKDYTQINHIGDNPNYTAYTVFRPKEDIGIFVLSNSNSLNTRSVARYTMAVLTGEENPQIRVIKDSLDKIFTIVAVILSIYLVPCIISLILMIRNILNKKRKYEKLTKKKIIKFIIRLIISVPFIIVIYLLPSLLQNTTWNMAIVWGPTSFIGVVRLIAISLLVTYTLYLLSLMFPKAYNSKKEKSSI